MQEGKIASCFVDSKIISQRITHFVHRFRAVNIDSFVDSLSSLHEQFDWPYPTLESVNEHALYLRSQSLLGKLLSPQINALMSTLAKLAPCRQLCPIFYSFVDNLQTFI